MSINDKNTPTDIPVNEFTQMMDEVAARNRRGGSLPPERGTAITAVPQPSVRSASLGTVTDAEPEQLSMEDTAELNRLALESGLIRGPVTPGIANTLAGNGGIEDAQYGTLEEAIAAGAPVTADEEAIAVGAARFRDPSVVLPPVRSAVGSRQPRQTAREFIAAQPASQLPRLPDFRKVQMIDLVNGKIYVDGLEFDVSKENLQMLRKFCVTTAKDQIQRSLADALAALEAEDVGGGAEEV